MAATGSIALLREDPELGAAIPPDEFADAERLLLVPGFVAGTGPLALPDHVGQPHLGLLVLDGLLTVNVVLGDRVASLLVGAGDVLDPAGDRTGLLPVVVEHHVSASARLAVLDGRFIAAVRRWPALLLTLHARLREQEHRLAVHAALGKLRRVEDRVLALLWHLGERWGRVGPDGVVVPLGLTHETIGRLAGAERPTVSLALADLAREGAVTRRPDGAFVLDPQALERLRPEGVGAPQLRSLVVSRTPETARETAQLPLAGNASIDREALVRRIAALHAELPDRRRSVEELLDVARRSTARSIATRERLAARRARERL